MTNKQITIYESLYGHVVENIENDDEVNFDPEASAADYAMTSAEQESISLYGEVDIDRLAKERYDFSDEPDGLTAGEQYIEYLSKNQVDN